MKISDNFGLWEFACHDGTQVPVFLQGGLYRLVLGVLEPLRKELGRPVSVISGYRTPGYNAKINGAPQSAHMTAEAADIRAGDPAALHLTVLRMHKEGRLPELGGVGVYPGWVHVDVRKARDGHLRRWSGGGIGREK
jgi:uncharacterized protein YcbK (DUF882 family)